MLACALVCFLAPASRAGPTDGLSPQAISLPSGPGSIEGLGESFEPQLNTGTATYSVALEVPPGRLGVEPSLAIRYNGGSGNGMVGIGWSLSGIDSIHRQTDKGLPRYDESASFSGTDTFVTMGGEELVPLSDGTFRAENEGAFRRYSYDLTQNEWLCEEPDGTKRFFGEVAGARIENGGRTFGWYLTSLEDTHGNRIEYTYRTFADSPGQVFPDKIFYTRHATQSLLGEHVVVFGYETATRPDRVRDFRPGFERTTGRRLVRVDLCTIGGSFTPASLCDDVGVAGAARVRLYEMDYDDAGSCETNVCARGLVGRTCSVDSECVVGSTRLRQVTQLGDDGLSTLPPINFSYTELAPVTASSWRGLLSFPSSKIGSGDVAFIDIDADALPDVIESPPNTPTQYTRWRNRGPDPSGTVSFAPPGPIGAPPQRLSTVGTSLLDVTGDGITDLLYKRSTADGDFGLRPGNGRGFFGLEELVGIGGLSTFSPLGLEDPSLRTADLDFDKRIDILRIVTNTSGVPTSIRTRYSIEVGGIRALGAQVTCAPVPNADFTNGKTFLTDMNGDRLLDLVVVDTSTTQVDSIVYYPGTGRGGFGVNGSCATQGAPITISGDPVTGLFGADFDGFQGFRFVDLTNDGLTDLLWTGRTNLSLWVNVGGDRLRRVDLDGWTPGTDYDRCLPGCDPATSDVLEIADMNGNGTADIVHVDRETNGTRYLDLVESDGVPPNLLRTIDNGLGALTTIDYEPSTSDFLESLEVGGTPWISKAPFPVTVVARKRVRFGLDLDGVPGEDEYVTDYRYRDAYYDGIEKEFRGFSEVERIDRGDASQPTLLTRHSFHTGAPDGVDNDGDGSVDERTARGGAEEEALKGLLLESRRETCVDGPDGDCATVGGVFDHNLSRWEVRTLYGATGRVCSGNTTEGCCSDLDCSGSGLGGSCVAGGSAEVGRLPEEACEAGQSVRWAVPVANRSSIIEQGAGPRVELMTTMDFDEFGNETERNEWGVVDVSPPPGFGCQLASGVCQGLPTQLCGSDVECGSFGPCEKTSAVDGQACGGADPFAFANSMGEVDERLTSMTWAVDDVGWQLRCQQADEIRNAAGALEQHRRSYFDQLPLGSCSEGDPTRDETWLASESRWVTRERKNYDEFGNLIESFDGNDNRRSLEYDASFMTHPTVEKAHLEAYDLNSTASYHEGFGRVSDATTWADAGVGPAYQFRYDAFSRLVETIEPGDSASSPTREYDYQLNPSDDALSWVESRQRETAGGGAIVQREYVDALGRPLASVVEGDSDSEWVVSSANGYGGRGTQRAIWYPYFASTIAYAPPPVAGDKTLETRDAISRIVEISKPDGASEATAYRPLETDEFDENDTAGLTPGAFATERRDGLGRIVEIVERPAGVPLVTRYEYDARDDLIEILDAQQNRTEMVFDSLSRLVEVRDPDRGLFRSVFDDADNIVETEDARGQVIVMRYDRANRLLEENYLDQTGDPATDPPDVVFHYDRPFVGGVDLGDGTLGTATFAAGQLSWVEDRAGREVASYDARRRLKWSARTLQRPRSGQMVTFTTRFEYDSADRPVEVEYPDGDRVRWTYGARGLPDTASGALGGIPIVESSQYEPSSRLSFIRLGNGVESAWTYDSRLRPVEVFTVGAGNTAAQALVHDGYEYDPHSNLLETEDRRAGIPAAGPRNVTRTYEYDAIHRLTRYRRGEAAPAPSPGAIDYQWDGIGNLVFKGSDLVESAEAANIGTIEYGGGAGASGRGPRLPGDAPGPHAPTAATGGAEPRALAFDDNGNVTSFDGFALTWDYEDHLVEIDGPEFRIEYLWDHSDRRVATHRTWKVDSGPHRAGQVDSTFYPARSFQERSGQATKFVFIGDRRVAVSTGRLDSGAKVVQRLELLEGWNLISVNVDAPDVASQLGTAGAADLLVWDSAEGEFSAVGTSPILAGSVLWVRFDAATATSLVGGVPAASQPVVLDPQGLALALAAESVPLSGLLPPEGRAWVWDAAIGAWRVSLSAPLEGLSDAPAILRPGEVAFVRAPVGSRLDPLPAGSRIRFFHRDRLRSVRSVTDGDGRLVEERDYLPFGAERFRLAGDDFALDENAYAFQDREVQGGTGLLHMTNRFYLAALGSFISVDDKRLESRVKRSPRVYNAYGYGSSNPNSFVDPLGLESRRWNKFNVAANWKGDGTVGVEADVALYSRTFRDKFVTGTVSAYKGSAEIRAGLSGLAVSGEAAIVKGEVEVEIVDGLRATGEIGVGAGFEASIGWKGNRRKAKLKAWLLAGGSVEADLTGLGVMDPLRQTEEGRAVLERFSRSAVAGVEKVAGPALEAQERRRARLAAEHQRARQREIYNGFEENMKRQQFVDQVDWVGSQDEADAWFEMYGEQGENFGAE